MQSVTFTALLTVLISSELLSHEVYKHTGRFSVLQVNHGFPIHKALCQTVQSTAGQNVLSK